MISILLEVFLPQAAALKANCSNFLPSAPVRAFAVFPGPIPPELTVDTLITYIA